MLLTTYNHWMIFHILINDFKRSENKKRAVFDPPFERDQMDQFDFDPENLQAFPCSGSSTH